MVYQVGRPAMFDGKRFLPLTGIPMPKMLLSRTLLADCEPDPLTVATCMLKSFTTRLEASCADALEACWPSATSPVAIGRSSLRVKVGKMQSFSLHYRRLRGRIVPLRLSTEDFNTKW